MFKKYNDTPAAIAIGIFLIGALFYAVQLVFMAESWLAAHAIGPEAIPVARVLGATYFGFSVGMVLTFVNGPDGQRTFFIALSVAQVLSFVFLWQARITGGFENVLLEDLIAISVLTVLLLFGFFKLRSRL